MQDERLDALVVGAGPTGLTMACELRRRGLRVRVVDPLPASRHSKALVLHVRTQEVFERMGVLAAAEARAVDLATIHIMGDAGRPLQSVRVQRGPGRFPGPRFLDQSTTEEVLLARLTELGGAVERGARLTAYREVGDEVVATLATPDGPEEVRAAWLLGCDGAHSAVRHLAGIPFEGAPYEDVFDQADLKIRWERAPDQGFVHFREQGAVVFFPLPRGRYRIICVGGARPAHDPTLADFQRLLDEVAPGAEAHDPDWIVRFRLHLRMVPRMREGRAFLAGDAAHIHSPAGGQGMNTGIQDAFNLAWKLALVQTGAAAPGLLASYDAERRPVAAAVLRFTDATFRQILARRGPVAWLRSALIRRVLGRDGIQRRVTRIASQTQISYHRAGTGVDARRWPRRGPRPGDRAPDLVHAAPRPLMLALAAAPWFALVQLPGRDEDPALAAAAARVAARWPDHVTTLRLVRGTCPEGHVPEDTLYDAGGELDAVYAPRGPELLLVRPDGHIAVRAPLAAAAAVERHLEGLLTR